MNKYDSVIKVIREKALKKMACDNPEFNALDFSGGNFDDAYAMGSDDGEILFARKIMGLIDEVDEKDVVQVDKQ